MQKHKAKLKKVYILFQKSSCINCCIGVIIVFLFLHIYIYFFGRGGIRTHGTYTSVFKTETLNHSDTRPFRAGVGLEPTFSDYEPDELPITLSRSI